VESVRILRAAGNLKIAGSAGSGRTAVEIDSGTAPRVSTSAGVAEVTLRDNATVTLPAGVTVEVEDVAGNLDLADLSTPLVVSRTRGASAQSRCATRSAATSASRKPAQSKASGFAAHSRSNPRARSPSATSPANSNAAR